MVIHGQFRNPSEKSVSLVLALATPFKLIRGTDVCRLEWSVVVVVVDRVVVVLLVVPRVVVVVVVLPLVRDLARGILRALTLFYPEPLLIEAEADLVNRPPPIESVPGKECEDIIVSARVELVEVNGVMYVNTVFAVTIVIDAETTPPMPATSVPFQYIRADPTIGTLP